jgi:N-acetylglucosamine kinase-like BadF-type ATPase
MFERATVEDVSAALHVGEIPYERIHDLTPVLFAVAAAGDRVAARVVERQAAEIVSLVRVAAGRLALLDAAYGVVLGGSVLAAPAPDAARRDSVRHPRHLAARPDHCGHAPAGGQRGATGPGRTGRRPGRSAAVAGRWHG